MTGVTCLRPAKGDLIPEGYTVVERTPRNFVANMAGKIKNQKIASYSQKIQPRKKKPLKGTANTRHKETTNRMNWGKRRDMKTGR